MQELGGWLGTPLPGALGLLGLSWQHAVDLLVLSAAFALSSLGWRR